jgi:hypothetical protein
MESNNNEKRTVVVSFASIKGGVGKTHIAILLADCLAAGGKKVLLVDSDLNNSLSYHYLDAAMLEKTRRLNFAAALGDEGNNLCDFAVPTRTAGVDLIASSPYLADLRTLNEKRLKRLVPTLDGEDDILIIDCHPTYDNIVLNALHAADGVALSEREYFTRGSTALLDAVGKTINEAGSRLAGMPEGMRPGKVIFVITTDGLENASREFSYGQVKALITQQTEKYGWEFIFMGANIDVAAEGGKLGIKPDRSLSFTASAAGIGVAFSAMNGLASAIRAG